MNGINKIGEKKIKFWKKNFYFIFEIFVIGVTFFIIINILLFFLFINFFLVYKNKTDFYI
jgi:hypothetical protein